MVVGAVGSAFGFCLGLPLLWSSADRGLRWLGALLVVSAGAVATITVDHAGVMPAAVRIDRVEIVLTLLVGPVLYLYIRGTVGRVTGRDAWLAAPALLLIPAVAIDLQVLSRSMSIRHVVPVQMAYTAAAAFLWLRRDRAAGPEAPWPPLVLAGLGLVHAAQVLRMSLPDAGAFRSAVPLVLTASFLALGATAFHRQLRPVARAPDGAGRYRRSALRRDRVPAHLGTLARLMDQERLFTNPELTLAMVAARVGLPAYQVSQLLNQHLKLSFADWVTGYRVREAMALLKDPANDVYTVEGMATTAGFRSRAGFYRAFRSATGVTPTAFRHQYRPATGAGNGS